MTSEFLSTLLLPWWIKEKLVLTKGFSQMAGTRSITAHTKTDSNRLANYF